MWTPELVFDRVKAAARVWRALPDIESRFRVAKSGSWPGFPNNPDEAFNYTAATVRVAPSMEAIDDAEDVWGWLGWLSQDSRKAVFLLASGVPVKRIARKLSVNRSTVYRMKDRALMYISQVLNK